MKFKNRLIPKTKILLLILCFCIIGSIDSSILANDISSTEGNINKKSKNKKTKFLVYIAADNDLFPFAQRNLKQLENIGSNDNVKIYAHFDLHPAGYPKMTKRLIMDKGKTYQVGPDKKMDSGNPNTLIDFCKWAIVDMDPEKDGVEYNHVLVLWNHGTGAIEPKTRHAFNPTSLWHINPDTYLREVNREINFLDFIKEQEKNSAESELPKRGICFDDTTGNYLTNKDLKNALHEITSKYLKKKFSIVAFDACLMSMIEVYSYIKDHAKIAVGSQEVELGTGWDYYKVLQPFFKKSLNEEEFADHIVKAYANTYNKITNDFTQSAINLEGIAPLEQNIKQVSKLLIHALENQSNRSVKEAIYQSRHRKFCTHFDEPTYIDLDHFYANLYNNSNKFLLRDRHKTKQLIRDLQDLIQKGRNIIKKLVIANSVGKNFKNASGLSIFLPENRIYNSYYKCDFAIDSSWLKFVQVYTSTR